MTPADAVDTWLRMHLGKAPNPVAAQARTVADLTAVAGMPEVEARIAVTAAFRRIASDDAEGQAAPDPPDISERTGQRTLAPQQIPAERDTTVEDYTAGSSNSANSAPPRDTWQVSPGNPQVCCPGTIGRQELPGYGQGLPDTGHYVLRHKNGMIDLNLSLTWILTDDMHAAQSFLREHPGEMHYVPRDQAWYRWDGTCHRPVSAEHVGANISYFAERYQIALEDCRGRVRYEADQKPDKERNGWLKEQKELWGPAERYAAGLRKSAGLRSLLAYTATLCEADPAVFADRWPEFICCPDGIWSLRTGQRFPHDPRAMMTACLPFAPKDGPCPLFLNVVHRVAGRDDEIAAFLLLLGGYALMGDNPERIIPFLNGPSSSGKSVLLQVLRGVLGAALGHDSPAELITWNPRGRNARAENSIRGMRLVTITETDRRMHVDEAQLKHLTGERELSVNQHYAKKELDTLRTWLIVVATNDMAVMSGWDDGVAERVLIIPTGQAIPREDRVLDLAEKIIEQEGPQVLALLMRKARKYYREGLAVPQRVKAATAAYAVSQDTVAQWLADRTVPDPSHGYRTAMPDAWQAYQQHAPDGERLTRNKFHDAMKEQPGIGWTDDGARQRYYTGFIWAG